MIKILLQNSIRQLIRNKLFAFLNILGLTIGISSCWLIFKFVNYELSYEQGLHGKELTYRLVNRISINGGEEKWSGGVSRPIFFALRDEMKWSKQPVPFFWFYAQSVKIPGINGRAPRIEELDFDGQIIETEESYFEMTDHIWLAGSKEGALSTPNQVVLTQDRANFYFPDEEYNDVIGQTLIYSDTIQKTITGVVADLHYPSELRGKEFFQLQKREKDNQLNEWTNTNSTDRVYVQASSDKELAHVYKQISMILDRKMTEYKTETKPPFTFDRNLELIPISESHFSTYMQEFGNDKTSKTIIYSLIALGAFLLVLACINYVNLTTAQIPRRSKEIGVRKTFGGSRKSLIIQMMTETLLLISISVIASYFISKLGFSLIGDLISEEIKTYNSPLAFSVFIFLILFTTLLTAGLYPSWLIAKVNAVEIFRNKGNIDTGRGHLNLRKILIVFQFIIAQVFIVASIIIGQQLRYTIGKDLGFNKEAVVLVDIPYRLRGQDNFTSKKKTLAIEIEKLKGVKEVSLGNPPLAGGFSSTMLQYNDPHKQEPYSQIVLKKEVDAKYLDFYELKLLAGNNLTVSDTTNGFVINETALRGFGFQNPQDALGKVIGQEGFIHPIVGVVQDFHSKDFYNTIEPLALLSGFNSNTFNVRLDQRGYADWSSTISQLRAIWSQFFPIENFDYKFLDESIYALYKKEQHLKRIINISTSIAIVLSCLGLFGLATISAYQRKKEIGIRKVLGASISGIMSMLSKDFMKMVFLAVLIASPIVWWLCSEWLQDFAYRIELSWMPFVLGAVLAVGAAMGTVSYQAVKAARLKPVDSLRDE